MILEKGRVGGERQTEKHWGVASRTPPALTGDQIRSLGVRPDWGGTCSLWVYGPMLHSLSPPARAPPFLYRLTGFSYCGRVSGLDIRDVGVIMLVLALNGDLETLEWE